MRDRVLTAARQVGREQAGITCALNLQVRADADADPSVVAGPPSTVAAELAGFIRMGFAALNFIRPEPRAEQAERLAREVLPEVTAVAASG